MGNRQIILKPNMVSVSTPLCATPLECLEGVLEFLKSIGLGNRKVIIAESAAGSPAQEGFSNYQYFSLSKRYPIDFVDLDEKPCEMAYILDEGDFRPHPVRVSQLMIDPNNYVISATRLKTHDRVGATLTLKNVVFGSILKDPGFVWGKPGAVSDKGTAHGSGFRAIAYNLFTLAPKLHPHLSVIDGYDGMEGDGPADGTPVPHRIALASPDWLAADRLGIELMGMQYAKVAYLNYCAQAGLGQGDLSRIEILGETLQKHIRPYKMAPNYKEQVAWL
jgi:uncharacterized protein (DUF362 family)